MKPSQAAEAAALFNDLFALPLGWDDSTSDSLSREDALELRRLVLQLIAILDDRQLERAIRVLVRNRFAMRADPTLVASKMENWGLTEDHRKLIAEDLDEGAAIVRFSVDNLELLPSESFHREFDKDGADIVFDLFLSAEERVLRRAGLNQSSIAIVMHAIRANRSSIIDNMIRGEEFRIAKYRVAISDLDKSSENLVDMEDARAVGMVIKYSEQKVHKLSKALNRAKAKAIALATLFGDAAPLVLSQDWGIAGTVSCIAGAAVGSLLPSSRGE